MPRELPHVALRLGKRLVALLAGVACIAGAATLVLICAVLIPDRIPHWVLLAMLIAALATLAYTFHKLSWQGRAVLAVSVLIGCFLLAPKPMCAAEPSISTVVC
jgi:hypothetical protein